MRGSRPLTDWMSLVDGSKSLRSLTIPGTHDSGSFNPKFGTGIWAKTQDFDIVEQLKMGVRFLDIRLYLDDSGEPKVCHGPINLNIYFSGGSGTPTIMGWCRKFLEEHKNETIIMSIKEERDSSQFDEMLRKAINVDKDIWLTGNEFPTLRDARGKIVLVRRWNTMLPNPNFGIDASPHYWKGDTVFEIDVNKQCIQDDWDASWKWISTIISNKYKAVLSQMDRAISGSYKGFFFWNFTSMNSGASVFFSGTPHEIALGNFSGPGVLQKLEGKMRKHPYGPHLGAVIMDYVGGVQDLLLLLVDRNMGPVWPLGKTLNGRDMTWNAPFACSFTDKTNTKLTYLFWRANDGSNIIYFTHSADGKMWPDGEMLNGKDETWNALAACEFTNGSGDRSLYLFYRASDGSDLIYSTKSSDGRSWPEGRPLNGKDKTPEALGACAFKNGEGQSKLYLFWRADDRSNLIYFTSSTDGAAWPDGKPLNGSDATPGSLCACVFKQKLYVFSIAGDGVIKVTSSADGKTWPPSKPINGKDSSNAGMSACVFGDRLYLFWKANDDSNLMYFSASLDGEFWPDGWVVNSVDKTPSTPNACVIKDEIFLSWKANDDGDLIYRSTSTGPMPINP